MDLEDRATSGLALGSDDSDTAHRLRGRVCAVRWVLACALVRTRLPPDGDHTVCHLLTEPWMVWVGWAQVMFDSESEYQRVQVRKLRAARELLRVRCGLCGGGGGSV